MNIAISVLIVTMFTFAIFHGAYLDMKRFNRLAGTEFKYSEWILNSNNIKILYTGYLNNKKDNQ